MATSLKIDFPDPYQPEHDLRSGDLLFPKNPHNEVVAAMPAVSQILRQFGALAHHQHAQVYQVMSSSDPKDKRLQAYLSVLESKLNRGFGLDFSGPLALLDLPDLIYLYRLLFDDIADQIGSYLEDINLTFGHVAMVFKESGEWFVAEAGCTDYSHYRVSIAPYFDLDDCDRVPGQKRGWAARRAALGQCTWTARHTKLDSKKFPDQLPTIVNEFKNWLSVPYGILEPGMMKNPDRMYCSEVLVRSFEKADIKMDKNQKWVWVLDQILGFDGAQHQILKQIIGGIPSKFPLLSPKMIYKSSQLAPVFKPTDAQGIALVYA